jgi:hypothetical protein
MAIGQPTTTDKQNNPDHSLSHRVFANDSSATAQAVVVDASNNTKIGDGGSTNYAQFTSTGTLSFVGTGGIVIPHMMQSDTTDQAIANTANAQVITFNTDVHHNGITRTSASRFTITKEGSYLIAFSGIATGVINKKIEFWLRVDGSDVANSNTTYTFKSTGANAVIAVTFIEHFAVGQYFEFWTWGDDTGNRWDATVAGTSPTRPAIPSIIITANYVGQD